MQTHETIQAAIRKVLGAQAAFWAPGVTPLGWSFHVPPGTGKVIVNPALGAEAKRRYVTLLPAALESEGHSVTVEVCPVLI
jgi:hypothetical protein